MALSPCLFWKMTLRTGTTTTTARSLYVNNSSQSRQLALACLAGFKPREKDNVLLFCGNENEAERTLPGTKRGFVGHFRWNSRHFSDLVGSSSHRGGCNHLAISPFIESSSTSSLSPYRNYFTSSSRSSSADSSSSPATPPPVTPPSYKKENIATIPNMLTASRMALSPVIGYLVVTQCYASAMVLFAIAGVTDLLDGYVARNFAGQASRLGMAIDPLADKLLMTIMTLSLTWADLFPATLTVLIITRDVLLIASGFALRYFSLTPPITLKRYFDISLPSAEVYPTLSSKVNTLVQLVAVAASLAAPLVYLTDSPLLRGMWILAGVTTVISGASYAYNGASCFKILAEENKDGGGTTRKVSMKEIQMMGGIGFFLGLAFVCWKTI